MAKPYPESAKSPMHEEISAYGARTSTICGLCKKKGRFYLLHLMIVSDEIDPRLGQDHYLVCPYCDVEPSER